VLKCIFSSSAIVPSFPLNELLYAPCIGCFTSTVALIVVEGDQTWAWCLGVQFCALLLGDVKTGIWSFRFWVWSETRVV
jgi:hypothetical protein